MGGTANQPTEQQTDTWSTASGATAVQETQVNISATSAEASTTNFSYAANDQQADALTLATNGSNETTQQVSACNPQGDPTAQSNSSGVGMQTLAYTDSANPNLPTQITDPLGTTADTYDSHGNLLSTQRTLNASGNVSCTQDSYNSQGLVSEQQQLISGTPSSNPIWDRDRLLATSIPTASPARPLPTTCSSHPAATQQNLTQTTTYDPFGNLLTQTDWSNRRVTQTNTYDLAGEKLTSTDAYGITTNNSATTAWVT